MRDGAVFDLVPEVADRYLGARHRCRKLKVWSFLSPAALVRPGDTLRILADALFHLRWSLDGWQHLDDTPSRSTRLGFHYIDIPVPEQAREPVRFTFYWPEAGHWEGKDFSIDIDLDHP
jgi:glucoamylase